MISIVIEVDVLQMALEEAEQVGVSVEQLKTKWWSLGKAYPWLRWKRTFPHYKCWMLSVYVLVSNAYRTTSADGTKETCWSGNFTWPGKEMRHALKGCMSSCSGLQCKLQSIARERVTYIKQLVVYELNWRPDVEYEQQMVDIKRGKARSCKRVWEQLGRMITGFLQFGRLYAKEGPQLSMPFYNTFLKPKAPTEAVSCVWKSSPIYLTGHPGKSSLTEALVGLPRRIWTALYS